MPVRRPSTGSAQAPRTSPFARASVARPTRAARSASSSPAAGEAAGGIDRIDRIGVRTVEADLKLRTSALATSGPTKTRVPDLLEDWKQAVVYAAARDAARAEMMPDARRTLRALEQQRGAAFDEDDVADVIEAFFDSERGRLDALTLTHLKDLDGSGPGGPRERERTIQRVLVEERPRVQQLRDPFSPVAQRDPAARAREAVLWENGDAMVLVDLFAPMPKALVVPKQPVTLASDAPRPLVDALARLAAHVSDAFMDVAGTPPAGIWVNPPQDLTVKQLHVHVLPALPDWLTFLGAAPPAGHRPVRAVQAAKDPQVLLQMQAFFQQLTAALERRLGPSS